MPRQPEHILAAKEEAERLGAKITFDYCKKHIIGLVTINEKHRKVFLSKTPSCYRVADNIREDVRKKVKEMSR